MRRCVLPLLIFSCVAPAQTKKVIANLPPEMVKELATSAPPVRIVLAHRGEVAPEIADADAIVAERSEQTRGILEARRLPGAFMHAHPPWDSL